MLSWLIRRRITAFERSFEYDASYAHEMLALNRSALLALNRLSALGRVQDGIPTDVYFAAKLATALQEDCGPCVQLVATMADRAGVPPQVISAVLRSAWTELPEDVALSAQFAHATLHRRPEADPLREALQQRFGRAGLISLALAISAGRIYPGIKYALGYGHHCQRVIVGGRPVAPALAPAALEPFTL
jgi:alkylhydroperoxidase family enzyme